MPSYYSALNFAARSGFRRSTMGLQGGLQNSVEALLGRGKLLLGNSGLSLIQPFSTHRGANLFLRPSTVFASKSDFQLITQPRNLSFLGALSRTLSMSPISGPSVLIHEYHTEVSFDGSSDEQLANSTVSSDQMIQGFKTLNLQSGSCYLPHPDKEDTGGEDAYFICVDEQAIGVADGVGGWRDMGIDSGKYARELMSNSVTAIKREPKGSVDLAKVLEKAHSCTKARGSSTACIVALRDQAIQAINLGDSGFIVIRDGHTLFQSSVQQHGFNFPYQLERGNNSDLPSSGQVFNVPVAPGDVIVAGTDGLFDNLYNSEVTGVVVHAVRAGLGPQVTAQKIAALARQRAQDSVQQTPFSTAAQMAGLQYYGGKLDDITVVVSYISISSTA